jgi:hypothetical protein
MPSKENYDVGERNSKEQQGTMMDYKHHRRYAGLVLGLVLGFGYSLSENLATSIILPDIPLYSPPPGAHGLFLFTGLMFGVLGLIAAWGEESLPNILAAGLMGSLISWIWFLVHGSSNILGILAILIVLFPPFMFVYLPFGALVRWLIFKLDQPAPTPVSPLRKLRPVFYSFVLLVLLGTFGILPKETRISLARMKDLLETGMQVESTSFRDLPKPLQTVEGFIPNAIGEYSFIVGSDPDVLPVQRPIVNYLELEPLIIIRFENGFRFGCVFSPPYVDPSCIDF